MLCWDMTVPWGDFGDPDLQDRAIARFRAAGFHVVSLTIATDPDGVETTLRKIARERARFAARSDCLLIDTLADIALARASGHLGILFNFQGSDAFGRDVRLVEPYFRLGVRHALLAYNLRNAAGDGCHERSDGGLSHYGLRLVSEMNRVGMLVDLSHTGARTAMDALEASTQPVIFSHANPKALCDHARTIDDDAIRRCAATGGVVGISGVELFLGGSGTMLDRVVRHIDYCVQLTGPDHVGLGSDFVYDVAAIQRAVARDTSGTWPKSGGYAGDVGFLSPEEGGALCGRLAALGYDAAAVANILGGNWHRLCAAAWTPRVSS